MTSTVLCAKVIETENKIPHITNLAYEAVLNTEATKIENKIPDTSHFINTQELNRLKKISLDVRMEKAEKSLASKTDLYK